MTVWVLVADASRARIFEAESRLGPIRELHDLVHPASRVREQGLVSDSPGQGRGHALGGGPGHSVGHEHDASRTEEERFAREVAESLARACAKGRFQRLHVLAAPRFLGLLRKRLDGATRALLVSEHDLDLSTSSAEQIRAHLPERL